MYRRKDDGEMKKFSGTRLPFEKRKILLRCGRFQTNHELKIDEVVSSHLSKNKQYFLDLALDGFDKEEIDFNWVIDKK